MHPISSWAQKIARISCLRVSLSSMSLFLLPFHSFFHSSAPTRAPCTIWNWFSRVPCYSKGVQDVLLSYSLSVYCTHCILSALYWITSGGLSVNQIFWCTKLIGRSCVYSSADSSSYLFITSLIWLSELLFFGATLGTSVKCSCKSLFKVSFDSLTRYSPAQRTRAFSSHVFVFLHIGQKAEKTRTCHLLQFMCRLK